MSRLLSPLNSFEYPAHLSPQIFDFPGVGVLLGDHDIMWFLDKQQIITVNAERFSTRLKYWALHLSRIWPPHFPLGETPRQCLLRTLDQIPIALATPWAEVWKSFRFIIFGTNKRPKEKEYNWLLLVTWVSHAIVAWVELAVIFLVKVAYSNWQWLTVTVY